MAPLSACKLLLPPYLVESGWRAEPPLGSILLWQLSSDQSATQTLLDVRASAPWCSLVVQLPDDTSRIDPNGSYDALLSVLGLPVFVKTGISPVAAIRSRRPPTLSEIVRYVERRPGHERLAAQLRLLAEAGRAELSHRSVRHHFRHSNHSSPRYWRWVIELAQVKTVAHESAEGLAARCGVEVRTLRHRVRTCLDVSLSQFRQFVGWEWRVEAALRLDERMRAESGGGAAQPELTGP